MVLQETIRLGIISNSSNDHITAHLVAKEISNLIITKPISPMGKNKKIECRHQSWFFKDKNIIQANINQEPKII